MDDDLKIILWPDPRLRKISQPVAVFDQNLKSLVARMFQLMREAHGVGLAAPQVGQNIRLFVTNPTGEEGDDHVYVNPTLSDAEGETEADEGCLSLPGINAKILRSQTMKIRAQDLSGTWFEEVSDDFPARVWQHELDHLNGTLLMDRMGPLAKMTAKKRLKELEEEWAEQNPTKKK
jgi:peptide deformylase